MRVRESQSKNLINTVLLSELKSTRFTTVYALVEDHYKYARKSSWRTVARGNYLQTAATLLFAPCRLIIKGLLTLTPCKSHHHQWHLTTTKMQQNLIHVHCGNCLNSYVSWKLVSIQVDMLVVVLTLA